MKTALYFLFREHEREMLHVGTEWANKLHFILLHISCTAAHLLGLPYQIFQQQGAREKKTEMVIIVAVHEMDFEAVK